MFQSEIMGPGRPAVLLSVERSMTKYIPTPLGYWFLTHCKGSFSWNLKRPGSQRFVLQQVS